MYKCRNYGPDKLNLWPFCHFISKCDLDLQPTEQEQLCQFILKSMYKCRSYGPDKLNLLPFYHLTFKCDLDLQCTWTNVSNKQLCQIILNQCTNVQIMAQTSSICVHFIIWPSSVTLTFNLPDQIFQMALWPSSVTLTSKLPEQMFRMALLLLWENNFAKLLWNPCTNVEYWPEQSQTDARTHNARTHIHWTEIITTMCLTHLKWARQKLFLYIGWGILLSIVFQIAFRQHTQEGYTGVHIYIYLRHKVKLPHPFVFMYSLNLETQAKTTMTTFLWNRLKYGTLDDFFTVGLLYIPMSNLSFGKTLYKYNKSYLNL